MMLLVQKSLNYISNNIQKRKNLGQTYTFSEGKNSSLSVYETIKF